MKVLIEKFLLEHESATQDGCQMIWTGRRDGALHGQLVLGGFTPVLSSPLCTRADGEICTGREHISLSNTGGLFEQNFLISLLFSNSFRNFSYCSADDVTIQYLLPASRPVCTDPRWLFFWPPPLCRDCVVYVLLCLLTQSPSSSLSLSFGYCFSHPQTSSKSTHKTRVVGANKISMRERERRRQDQKLCRCSYSWGLYYSLLLYQRGSGASKSPSSSNPPSRSDY